MPKLVDLGHKPTAIEGKKEKYYPNIYLYDKVPEELMDVDLGKVVECVILAKVTSKGIDEHGHKKTENMTLEVHKIGYIGKAGFDNKKK